MKMKPKKVKYKVTADDRGYGAHEEGDVVDVWLIVKEWETGLLFHPREKGHLNCASISISQADNLKGTRWVAIGKSADSYVNLTKKQEEFFIKAFRIPK